MTRDDAVTSLRGAPTWDDFEMCDVRLVTTGRGSGALVHRGAATRRDMAFAGLMSNVYVEVNGSWRLALYTQTAIAS